MKFVLYCCDVYVIKISKNYTLFFYSINIIDVLLYFQSGFLSYDM